MSDPTPSLLDLVPVARLAPDQRARLVQLFGERTAGPRRTLYHVGDEPPGVWFVVSGFVKLVRSSTAGKELLMSIAGPGDMFGPCCDPLAAAPASCTAITQGPLRALHMPYGVWKLASQSELAITQALLTALLASRRGCTELAPQLAFRSIEGRVAGLLASLARWSRGAPGPIELPKLLSQSEMADAIGTAREVVTRCLTRFEAQGLIRRRGRRIVLPDLAALALVEP